MYCPQCSQEQVAEEMRFCSRCGFPLAIVSELVRGGGALEGFDPEAKDQLSPRQRGVRWGLILMIVSALMFPLVTMMTAMKGDFFVLFIPVFLLFVFGLARLFHAYLLAQKAPAENKSSSAVKKTRALPDALASALPPVQSMPITNWRPVNTSEMAQPPSIIEHTTKLLNDETDER